MPLISIIVPIYNAELFLHTCIESILAQTFIDFELLLINDASTDNSINICYAYKLTDSRITVFDQKVNVGVAAARNVGLDNASAKYIVFIDCDDYILENHLKSLYYSDYIPTGTLVHAPHLMGINNAVVSIDNDPEPYFINDLFINETNQYDFVFAGHPWSKLLETKIIRDNDIRFRSGINSNDDFLFHLEYMRHISSYVNVGERSYVFNDTPGSLTERLYPFENYYKFLELSIPLTENIIQRFNVKDKWVQISFYSTPINALVSSIYSLYRFPHNKNKIDRTFCLNRVLENYGSYLDQFWKPEGAINKLTKKVILTKNIFFIDFYIAFIVQVRYSFLILFIPSKSN